MISLTTLFQLSRGLVVALLVVFASSRGDRFGSMRAIVEAGPIVAVQAVHSSLVSTTTPRPRRVDRPPSTRDAALELESDDDDGSSAPIASSVDVDLPRWRDVATKNGPARLFVLSSHWIPSGHPRGPPAARTV